VTTAQRPSPQTVSTRPTAVNAAAGVCVPSRSRGRCSMLRNILHERFSSRRETACVPFMHRLCVQMFVHTHHHHTFPAQRQHCRHFSNSVDVRLRRLIIEVGGVQADSTPQPSHKGRRSPSSTSETRELGNLQHKLANISIFKFQDFLVQVRARDDVIHKHLLAGHRSTPPPIAQRGHTTNICTINVACSSV
jgi:hypothetical protein